MRHLWEEVHSEVYDVFNAQVKRGNKVGFPNGDANRASNVVCDCMITAVVDNVHFSNVNINGKSNYNVDYSSNSSTNNYKKSSTSSISVVPEASQNSSSRTSATFMDKRYTLY